VIVISRSPNQKQNSAEEEVETEVWIIVLSFVASIRYIDRNEIMFLRNVRGAKIKMFRRWRTIAV
jgi:hypothetical protein